METTLEEFIVKNQGFIYGIINKYTRYFEKDDLFQVAVIGVMKALKKYDQSYNTKFLTYAYLHVLGEVIAFVNSNRPFKVSKDILSLNKKICEARTILTQRLMKEPSNYELSLFLEIDEQLINEVVLATSESDSLDRVVSEDGKTLLLMDTIADRKDPYNIDSILLRENIENLPEEERKIIEYRYFHDKTQKETADCLGVYQVQVSRSEKKALKLLKDSIQKVA